MSVLGAIAAITGALAWPAVIIIGALVLRHDWDHVRKDAAIVTLPYSARQVLREKGTKVVVYPTGIKDGRPRLDMPLTHRDMVGFDKRHPQWDTQEVW